MFEKRKVLAGGMRSPEGTRGEKTRAGPRAFTSIRHFTRGSSFVSRQSTFIDGASSISRSIHKRQVSPLESGYASIVYTCVRRYVPM